MLNYKFRIYPSKEQIVQIEKINSALKSIFNQSLFDLIEKYKETKEIDFKKVIKVVDLMKQENNRWIKEENLPLQCFHNMIHYEFMTSVKNYIKQNYSKYKNGNLLFDAKNEYGVPRFKNKNDKMTICYSNPKTMIENGRIYLTKIGYLKIVEHRKLQGKIKELRLSKDNTGKYYLSIRTDYSEVRPIEFIEYSEDKVCGIDFSLKQWITLSDGTSYDCPSFARDEEQRKAFLNTKKSALEDAYRIRKKAILKKLKIENPNEDLKILKKKAEKLAYSKHLENVKKELATLDLKIANRRKAFIEKIVNDIFKKYPVVVIPNLYVKELLSVSESRVKDKNINKKFTDASLGILKDTFIRIASREGLICKLARKDTPFVKTCTHCRNVNNDLDIFQIANLDNPEWECPSCKKVNNLFLNSAINLKKLFIEGKEDQLVNSPIEDSSYKKSLKQLEKEKQIQRDKNNPNLK